MFGSLESTNEHIKVYIESISSLSGSINCRFDSFVLKSNGISQDENGDSYIECPIPYFPNSDTPLSIGTASIVVEIEV